LNRISELLEKDFQGCDRNDIERLMRRVNVEGYLDMKGNKRQYSENSKQSFRVTLKKFFRWLRKTDENPPEVKWLKIENSKYNEISSDEIITQEEVKKLIKAAMNPRDRAFVAVIYDSGCRIGELISLKIKDVMFDEIGGLLMISGTDGSKRIRIIDSCQLLLSWLESHPDKNNPTAPIWIGIGYRNGGERMSYSSARTLLKRLFRRADIKKRCNPHLFRHSRASFLANHLTEEQMKIQFGWAKASRRPGTYSHLSRRDVDTALVRISKDAKEVKKETSQMMPKVCERCKTPNSFDAKFCTRCWLPLDTETAIENQFKKKKRDELLTEVMRDEEVQKVVTKKIVELGLKDRLEEIL